MPQTADNLARDFGIKREEADKFALRSQQRYASPRARASSRARSRPWRCRPARKGPVPPVADDEHPRPDTDIDALAKMKALYEGGVTTAGNASGVNDGAAAMVVGSRAPRAKRRARSRSRASSRAPPWGCRRASWASGRSPRRRRRSRGRGSRIKDMDIIEINEAFAAQVLSCLKGLGVAFDDNRVNPNGGAIAVGHPLGASGARLALTAARQLQRSGGRYALVSLCIGGGQGMAAILEKV